MRLSCIFLVGMHLRNMDMRKKKAKVQINARLMLFDTFSIHFKGELQHSCVKGPIGFKKVKICIMLFFVLLARKKCSKNTSM